MKNSIDKPANTNVSILLNYMEPKKSCYERRLWKKHFTNNLIERMTDILINHKKCTNYKFAPK